MKTRGSRIPRQSGKNIPNIASPMVFAKSLNRISDSLIGPSVTSPLDVVLVLPRLHYLEGICRCCFMSSAVKLLFLLLFKMVTVVLPF
jgi:hypothetical protein